MYMCMYIHICVPVRVYVTSVYTHVSKNANLCILTLYTYVCIHSHTLRNDSKVTLGWVRTWDGSPWQLAFLSIRNESL
jgi:hypothetical protein